MITKGSKLLDQFAGQIKSGETVDQLRAGLIGERAQFSGSNGERQLIYADYTASGRALHQVERFITEDVLPFYANSHTESSFCGAFTTRLREDARDVIARFTNAGDDCSVIFCGSGATAAVNRLVALSGITDLSQETSQPKPWFKRLRGKETRLPPVVLVGPYEHHSNILPWRECGAEVIEIKEAESGGPDMVQLEEYLKAFQDRPMIIGTFSAASNVTGIVTDADTVTKLLKRYGALAVWDYAGGGPYLPIDMNPTPGLEKDAIFLSPHKFPGGPGASGLLIIRHSMVRATCPTWPGGGSVSYVSPWGHDYLSSLIEREEAGTPNVLGDIRAALVFIIKDAVGLDFIRERDEELVSRAFAAWENNPNINVLAASHTTRLPIFSFTMTNPSGDIVHHEKVTHLLSDNYGIQARGGCACAGPYGHRLLDVKKSLSEEIRRSIAAGHEAEKPGWTRLNLGYLMDDKTADFIIASVKDLAGNSTLSCA